MLPLKTFCGLSLALSTVLAFQVHFYTGPHCTSADDGVVTIRLGDPCSTEYMNEAQSAIIVKEDTDGPNDSVFFSGTTDCSVDDTIAGSNGGACLDIDGEVEGHAKSFQVISGNPGGARKVKKSISLPITKAIGMQAKNGRRAALLAERQDDSSSSGGVYHGMQTEWNGEQIKYREAFNGIFIGVPLADWDDNLAANKETLADAGDDADYTDPVSENPQARALANLRSRAFKTTVCSAATVCSQAFSNVYGGLKDVGKAAVKKAGDVWSAEKKGKTFWEFLNMPFVTGGLTAGGSGWIVSIVTQKQPGPGNCSTTAAQCTQCTIQDALAQALASTGNVDALEIKILGPDGIKYVVSIQAQPTDNHTSGVCGAPSPNPP